MFPLFEMLNTEIKSNKKPLTKTEMKSLCKKITKLDSKTQKLVFAIIRHYQIKDDKTSTLELPYISTKQKNDLVFDIRNLPDRLTWMLDHFVHKHLQYMLERANSS